MDIELLREWKAREVIAKLFTDGLAEFKRQTLQLEERLLEQLAEDGTDSVRTDGPSAEQIAAAVAELNSKSTGADWGPLFHGGTWAEQYAAGLPRFTAYIARQFYGVIAQREGVEGREAYRTPELIERFKSHPEWQHLVGENVNHQTLGSWIREQIPAGGLAPVIPEELQDVLGYSQKVELRSRKA